MITTDLASECSIEKHGKIFSNINQLFIVIRISA